MINSKDERSDGHLMPDVRDGRDSADDARLRHNPGDEDAKLDVGVDETFPASDPTAASQPGRSNDPAPSSGYDPEAEKRLAGED
jgi:hypothetical protein